MNFNVITVTQLNHYIKSILDSDDNLNTVFLVGEISNLTDHYQSGHIYFSLKDEKSVVKAIAFSWFAKNLRFKPANGMKVIVRGRVSIYEPSGAYQIYVEDMQPDGVGALNFAFEQLKIKLEKEGLFDPNRKKPLPSYPKRIGVITAKTGAAFKDIQSILKRRFPIAKVLLYPVLVQGNDAPKQICDAIEYFNNVGNADVLIVGRGGGAIEDLWAFNDEYVARSVAGSEIPIISAVGHETDFTICDFVADLRAPTPSAAAELVVPNQTDLIDKLNSLIFYMTKVTFKKIGTYKDRLQCLTKCEQLNKQGTFCNNRKLNIEVLAIKLRGGFCNIFNKQKVEFLQLASKLDMLSPLKILKLGYSVALDKDEKIIKSIDYVKVGSKINVKLYNGILNCNVEEIQRKGV